MQTLYWAVPTPTIILAGEYEVEQGCSRARIRRAGWSTTVLEVIEVASIIRRIVDEHMSSAIHKEVVLRGYRPEEFVLFAFGGGGPTHAAGYHKDIPTKP